jgi:hypothetical protein
MLFLKPGRYIKQNIRTSKIHVMSQYKIKGIFRVKYIPFILKEKKYYDFYKNKNLKA